MAVSWTYGWRVTVDRNVTPALVPLPFLMLCGRLARAHRTYRTHRTAW